MTIDTQQAAQIIVDEVQAAESAGPQAVAAAIDMGNFCSIWPTARPILETVAGVITLIPGLGATAAAVLKGLLKVGDMIYAEQCS